VGDFNLHHPLWSNPLTEKHHKSAEALIQVAEHEFVRQPERLICLLASDLEAICVWCVQRIIVLQKAQVHSNNVEIFCAPCQRSLYRHRRRRRNLAPLRMPELSLALGGHVMFIRSSNRR